MRTKPKARTRIRAWLAILAAAAIVVTGTAPAARAQTDLMAVCSLYGVGYHYLSGTDICLNPDQRDARQQTSGGTWRWWSPGEPTEPIGNLKAHCGGGLVKFGDIDSSGLFVNDHGRFETTTRMPYGLEQDQYISQVIFRGGFTGVGRGSFCLYYTSEEPGSGKGYTPIACNDTAEHAAGIVPVAFTPRNPRVPALLSPAFIVAANGYPWPVSTPAEVGGRVEIWLCIKEGNLP